MRYWWLVIMFWSYGVWAQSSQVEKDFRQPNDEIDAYESISRVIKNSTIASGLASGADSINRSVDSLMESLFYSLMDEDINIRGSDSMSLVSGYRRDVHPTNIGTYVVVDRFQMGPDFLRELGKVRGLPLTFNGQSQLFVTNATYRSDASRKAEEQKAGFWTELFANWFGILPFLTNILPPSFNPLELYDPITYLKTPFLFPSTIDHALELPIGNIRSYGISGGASLAVDTAGRTARSLQESLGLSDLDLTIPLSVFRDGEHRISVLRRNQSHVWLALSELRRIGTGLQLTLGKDYMVFQKMVKWWAGVPAPITPVDFDLQRAKIFQIDELYDFDLQREGARRAFTEALHGDFRKARELTGQLQGQTTRPNRASGVTFQFYRVTTRNEIGHKLERSFYVAQSQRQSTFGVGESQTTDRDGQFMNLEAEHFLYDRNWNILVGTDTMEFRHKLSIPVRKEKGPRRSARYILTANAANPLYMTASLRIIDNFVDVRDYNRTVDLLRRYTGLAMDSLPEIPLYAQDVERKLLREQALGNPMDEVYAQTVSATHLGKLSATAHLYFSHDLLIALARKDERVLWAALAKAFDANPKQWAREGPAEGMFHYANLLGTYVVMPLRLLNIETGYPDVAAEVRRMRKGFEALLRARDPLEIQEAYHQIMDTGHPVEFMQALGEMAKGLPVPVVVGFSAQGQERGKDSQDVRAAKKKFEILNDRVFESPWSIPPLKRDQSVEEKLANFQPGGYRDPRPTPKLLKARVTLDRSARRARAGAVGDLRLQLTIRNMSITQGNLQAYIRFEQHGALDLGRFVLSEHIVRLSPNVSRSGLESRRGRTETFHVALNGRNGLSDAKFLDEAIANGDAFDMHISLSEDGETWSPEQSMSFAIEKGTLQNL
ncbi:hypothetical protein [Oligoflexus tunisiensis]|uniref:hypothetical protein n=1 Tax=Oligoflexus tunisiensis TaxID=708132 RepID=UPI00114CDC7E|nr:hypothetical protein [Oligoflexus tunisiensis]